MNHRTILFGLGQSLFFAFMWSSKTAHVLFFEEQSAMLNFGISYTSMAAAGYASFYVGYVADRIGFHRILWAGALLYALGLYLRTYPESAAVAAVSGILAGLGASAVLCGLRLWMVELATGSTTARMVGIKSATSSLGTALGCMAVGVLPTLFHSPDSMKDLLRGSALGVLVLAMVFYFWVPAPSLASSNQETKRPSKNFRELFNTSRVLFFGTLILGITTGFYVSFMAPYLPLIMKEKGLSLLTIGLSTASLALIRVFIDPLIAKVVESRKEHSLRIFLCAEMLLALVTGSLLWTLSKEAFLLVLILRSAMLGLSTISEEVLWLRTFPKSAVGLLFGLNQTGFFMGDFVGGLTNGFLYDRYGLNICIAVVLVIMCANAVLFLHFFRRRFAITEAVDPQRACG